MSKLLNRSIILTILGIITASCFGSWVLSRSKSTSSPGTYTSADRVSRPEEVARVIHEHVEVSHDFPIARISQQLVAIELASGGTTFTIYRFNFPQTCGRAGCLHVAVDRQDKQSIPLQLVDLPEREARHQGGRQPVFTSIAKTGCLVVKQPTNLVGGTIEDYEICKPK
jgi:hypothetical protein